MKRSLIALLTPLIFALPAYAEWPADARQNFLAECIEGAIVDHPAANAQAFCNCAADNVGREFQADELESMADGEIDSDVQHRLRQAAEGCSGELEG